mmetsp:Transcript_496/g.549  ORF Transcript_496/g.549 Transcript_496/m.549 type:complete len:214 (-) Transcript_496:759-1400(-)|eukprot:CAMPEP_0197856012 /NCGR_PEP_ID=MMETSP1438-20131217/27714_1 /TAXON_ID=1461541 /ORGANISM="Pterosperma sp., Strain CCMP1384" /LENGTH=213 /DNA_ID=CAMNT_0043471321 /DNA_START=78 /DNA_END=719 /DNA_ORIENTATION=+
MSSTSENLTPSAINSLTRELNQLQQKPEEGMRVFINEENIADIQAEFDGPHGTPYEGGVFRMKLVLPAEFPSSAPKGYFITKIFHPNIRQPSGEICVNTLKKDWQPTHGIRHILQVIRCLLIEPFPESALNEEAAKMLLEDYEGYAKHARMLTSIHAKAKDAKPGLTVSQVSGGAQAGEEPEGAEVASPMKKKAKAEKNTKQGLERKKSLKRL